MDKKNILIGVALLVAAFALMFYEGTTAPHTTPEPAKMEQHAANTTQAASVNPGAPTSGTIPSQPAASTGLFQKASAPEAKIQEPVQDHNVQTYTLKNEYIRVTFTSSGGAVKNVEFVHRGANGKLKYPATIDSDVPYDFNAGAKLPALAMSLDTDRNGVPEEYAPHYDLVKQTKNTILFAYHTEEGGVIYRGYKLNEGKAGDPYVIHHEDRFVNNSDAPLNLNRMWVNIGTAPATKGDAWSEFLNYGYYNGDSAEFVKMSAFTGSSGFLGIGASSPQPYVLKAVKPVIWSSVKNQFFAAVLTPSVPGSGIYSRPVEIGSTVDSAKPEKGVTGSIEFDLGEIAPGQQKLIDMQYYVGPKEFVRLQALGHNQDLVMQFGFFGFISKFLLVMMIWIHKGVAVVSPIWGWGWTIIIVTVIIKACLWPLTQVQARSAKRMGKIQGPLKELREKFKDQPQKIQSETMKLFKANRVNPAAGCLPIMVQIPIFFGLFFMLRTASELRFSPFLWIHDLALPDTIGHIAGLPINILPLLMTAAMVVQMRMTPTPTTDNMQRKVFQFMPIIFLFFCYSFPSGLVLYWTCQNLISIFQQWLTNRRKDVEPVEKKKKKPPTSGKPAATRSKVSATARPKKRLKGA